MSGSLDGGASNWDEIEQGGKKARSIIKIYVSGHANTHCDASDTPQWVCQEPVRDTESEVWASTSLEAL